MSYSRSLIFCDHRLFDGYPLANQGQSQSCHVVCVSASFSSTKAGAVFLARVSGLWRLPRSCQGSVSRRDPADLPIRSKTTSAIIRVSNTALRSLFELWPYVVLFGGKSVARHHDWSVRTSYRSLTRHKQMVIARVLLTSHHQSVQTRAPRSSGTTARSRRARIPLPPGPRLK